MPALTTPPRLYLLCQDKLVPQLSQISARIDWDRPKSRGPLENTACRFVEDLLHRAYMRASSGKTAQQGAGAWDDDWRIFLTPRISAAILSWDERLMRAVAATCKSLRRVLVVRWKSFTPDSLKWLPTCVQTLDFDGELFYRGRPTPELDFAASGRPCKSWLPDAETVLRAMQVSRQKLSIQDSLHRSPSDVSQSQLIELHLGCVAVSPTQLREVLQMCPQLRTLRHYQMVSALYHHHVDQWRRGDRLPTYKLRNLDVDFSHVVRCRMSPVPVLATDALQLVVRLCPDVTAVRVRYDCETPHDVLQALVDLRRLREMSVVCVSSGQRSLLDFTDIAVILEQHGVNMTALELKVIEEVDVHVVLTCCTKLERLVLSGCGNVTPPTCARYNCAALRLRRLRLLFFADGDDFSWDHHVPQCFWRATLGRHQRRGDSSHKHRLEGLFLESPRISPETAVDIFPVSPSNAPLFPDLQVLTLCRCPELSVEHLASICGLETSSSVPTPLRKTSATSLRYIRVEQCEQVTAREERRLRNMMKALTLDETLVFIVK